MKAKIWHCSIRHLEGINIERLLEIREVNVSLADVILLEQIDLELRVGEIVALTGPSGCGKTTLLRTLAGLLDPQAGDIRLQGNSPSHYGYPVYRRKVIYVNQQPTLKEGTVTANLALPFTYANAEAGYSPTEAEDLFSTLKLEASRLDQEAKSLSVGQQQRVCLIRALLLRPLVLLLDEPTGALDQDVEAATENLLRKWVRERDVGILIATHDRAQIGRFCDRVYDLTERIPEMAKRQ